MVLIYGYAKLVNFTFLKQDNFFGTRFLRLRHFDIFAIIPKYSLKID